MTISIPKYLREELEVQAKHKNITMSAVLHELIYNASKTIKRSQRENTNAHSLEKDSHNTQDNMAI